VAVGSYVVWLIGSEYRSPHIHFADRGGATRFARIQMQRGEADEARIYFVPNETEVRAAIAAVEAGKAQLLEAKGPRIGAKDSKAAWNKLMSKAVVENDKSILQQLLGKS
jgi:hypothetical protein